MWLEIFFPLHSFSTWICEREEKKKRGFQLVSIWFFHLWHLCRKKKQGLSACLDVVLSPWHRSPVFDGGVAECFWCWTWAWGAAGSNPRSGLTSPVSQSRWCAWVLWTLDLGLRGCRFKSWIKTNFSLVSVSVSGSVPSPANLTQMTMPLVL